MDKKEQEYIDNIENAAVKLLGNIDQLKGYILGKKFAHREQFNLCSNDKFNKKNTRKIKNEV